MKLRYFQAKSVEFQTRLLCSHLPSGRVWNTKTGRFLHELALVMGAGAFIIADMIYLMLVDFRIETSVDFLVSWEKSLGIETDLTLSIQQRRQKVKAQLRKVTIVSKEEWESVLSTALGKPITVSALKDFVWDGDFYLPNPVPTPLYQPFPDMLPQNRFIVVIDGINGSAEENAVRGIIKKFKSTNVYAIIIDRDSFF